SPAGGRSAAGADVGRNNGDSSCIVRVLPGQFGLGIIDGRPLEGHLHVPRMGQSLHVLRAVILDCRHALAGPPCSCRHRELVAHSGGDSGCGVTLLLFHSSDRAGGKLKGGGSSSARSAARWPSSMKAASNELRASVFTCSRVKSNAVPTA